MESVEYVSDSGETEEESEEEEEEDEEQNSPPHRQSFEPNTVMNPRLLRPLQHPRVPRQTLLWFRAPHQPFAWFRVLGAPRGPGTLLLSLRVNPLRWPDRVDLSLGRLCRG